MPTPERISRTPLSSRPPRPSRPPRRTRRPRSARAATGLLLAACAWTALAPAGASHPGAIFAPSPGPARAQTAAPRPVLLVHGWQGLEARGFDCADGVLGYDEVGAPDGLSPRQADEFGALAARIAAERPVFAARWTSSRSRTMPLEAAGACLAEQIAEVRRRTGATDVDIVGHSMGGLVARAYVEGRAVAHGAGGGSADPGADATPIAYRGDVARIVTLGTPHNGVAPEILVRLFALFNLANARYGFLPCAADPGTCQLASEAMRDWNAARPPNESVAHDLVAGARWTWTSWLLPGPDDGLITLPSAAAAGIALTQQGEGAAGTNGEAGVATYRVAEAHAALFHARHHYVDGTRTIACLGGLLALPGAAACTLPPALDLEIAGGPNGPGPTAAPEIGYTPLVVGELGPAQGEGGAVGGSEDDPAAGPLRTSLQVDPVLGGAHAQRLSVAASWGAGVGAAELVLTAPDGRLVEQATAAALFAGGAYSEQLRADGSGVALLDLPGVPAGTWQAELRAADAFAGPAAPAVAPAALFAAVASPLRLELDPPLRNRGGVPQLWAHLSRAGSPISDATLHATWNQPHGPRTIHLTPTGNGAYVAPLPGHAPPFASQIDVVAHGLTADGWSFERQATTLLPPADGGAAWLPWVGR